jgi:hypothetical protein
MGLFWTLISVSNGQIRITVPYKLEWKLYLSKKILYKICSPVFYLADDNHHGGLKTNNENIVGIFNFDLIKNA